MNQEHLFWYRIYSLPSVYDNWLEPLTKR